MFPKQLERRIKPTKDHTEEINSTVVTKFYMFLKEKVNQTFFSSRSIKPPSWHGNASNKNYDSLPNSSSTALINKP